MSRFTVMTATLSESDLLAASKFASITATESYGLRRFPTPEQYHQRVAQLAPQHIVPQTPILYVLAQRDWHIRGQTGCMFARLAACRSASLRWEYVIADYAAGYGPDYLEGVAEQVRNAAFDDQIEIVSILFPYLRKSSELEAMLRDLATHTPFWLERDEAVGGYRHLYLRYTVGTGRRPAQAWVMAFAPFHFLPSTRRSPYVELAIRVKEKPELIFHRLNQDRGVAHLADVPLVMPQQHWEHRWKNTLRRTRMILGSDPDEISAAKCTVAIPIDGDFVNPGGEI